MARQPEQGETKKLIEAAERWAAGGKASSKQLDDDAAAFGVIIEEEEVPEHFEVFPENWEAVCMWSRVCTQWRTSMDGAIGLDYTVLQWLFSLYDVEKPRELLEDLQVMEVAFLDFRARQGD